MTESMVGLEWKEKMNRIKYGWYSFNCAFQLWGIIMGNSYAHKGVVGWLGRPQTPERMLYTTLYFFWEEINDGERSW